MNPKEEKTIEREIEFLKESKETDKLNYQIQINVLIFCLAFLVSFIGLSNISANLKILSLGILCTFFIFLIYFTMLNPIAISLMHKNKMIKDRYKQLGVDIENLKNEKMKPIY